MGERLRVLVVGDDASMREVLGTRLGERDFVVERVEPGEPALARLRQRDDIDVVLSDLRTDGLALCGHVQRSGQDVPVVLLADHSSFEAAVAALRAGAFDYLTRPVADELVARALRGAAERHRAARASMQRGSWPPPPSRTMLGDSPALQELVSLIDRVAPSDVTVLLTGESGAGKELAARELHHRSHRRDGPFVAFDCAAVPTALAEACLFGSKAGAYTDAKADMPGVFAQSHGGTLFLDEVGELDPAVQPKLLRVLEERVFRPVGGLAGVPCDVRVIAATHRDLAREAREGRFREDLLFRLKVVELHVPPLRERGDDLILLARAFVSRFAAALSRPVPELAPETERLLRAHDWPGNVRELRNAMERAVVLAGGPRLEPEDLPRSVRHEAAGREELGTDPTISLQELERRHIETVLRASGNNKAQAARVLGIDRRTLYRKRKTDPPRKP